MKELKQEFLKKDVTTITGLPLRSVQYYTDEGVITPLVESSGSGSRRRYSLDNLVEFFIIHELNRYGAPLSVVKNTLEIVSMTLINNDIESLSGLLNYKGKPIVIGISQKIYRVDFGYLREELEAIKIKFNDLHKKNKKSEKVKKNYENEMKIFSEKLDRLEGPEQDLGAYTIETDVDPDGNINVKFGDKVTSTLYINLTSIGEKISKLIMFAMADGVLGKK